MSIPTGYTQQANGYFFKSSDGSGPYMIDASGGIYYAGTPVSNYGNIRTTDEPTALFQDSFETLDTTNRWTSKTSTGTAAVAAGALTVGSSTTPLAYGGLYTQPTFSPKGLNFIFGGILATLATVAVANTLRCVGFGTVPATPTIAVPITDGVGFFIDGTGALTARTYASGVLVSSTDLSAYNPVANVPMGLAIQYRGDLTTYYINSASNVVATVPIVGPNVESLPFFALSIAGAIAPAVSATMVCKACGIGDTGKNAQNLVDATFPWRGTTVDIYGAMTTRNNQNNARTYSCSVNVAAAAAATDIAVLSGSATTTVSLLKVIISGVQTTAGLNDILLIKRSTADTGGTSSAGTVVPSDSSDAAGTATVLAYTANPGALGTAVGTIRRNYSPIAGATSVVNPIVEYKFGDIDKEIVLRGVAQQLAVNLNGATLAGGTFDVTFVWAER